MRSWTTMLAIGLLTAVAGCKMHMPRSDQWVRAHALDMIQENAARAAQTGLVTVTEDGSYRVESIPMYRTAGAKHDMMVVTWAYAKQPGEGKPVYTDLVDGRGTKRSPQVDRFTGSFAPGLAEDVLSGQSQWTRSGDVRVRTQATPGAEGFPVYLFEKFSPAGHQSHLQKTAPR